MDVRFDVSVAAETVSPSPAKRPADTPHVTRAHKLSHAGDQVMCDHGCDMMTSRAATVMFPLPWKHPTHMHNVTRP
jgi:hypothetical protein